MNLFEKLNRLDDSKCLHESTKMPANKKLTESLAANEYELTYYNNSAASDRRPETVEDVYDDWKTEVFRADSNLDAWKEAFERVTGDYYDDFLEEDATEADFTSYFEDSDWGDGSPILIKLSSADGTLYDTGYTRESWIEEYVEDDYDNDIDEMLTEDLKDTDYVIVLTHPNMPQDKRYSYFGSNYRMTRDLNKAMTYPGKFSAKDEIKYALDATDGHWDPLYADRFSVMTVAQVKELLNAPKPEKVSRAVHHNPSAQEAAKPIAKEIHEVIKKHNVSLSSFLKLITQIIKSEDPTA